MSQGASDSEPQRISVRYVGPALGANSMDVRQLAPSLLALADLFTIAHSVAGRTLTPPPALEVTAQRGGSFIVDLWLAAQDHAVDLLTDEDATAAANGLGIGAVVVGAVGWLVQRRRRGREQTVTEVEPGTVQINWADGTRMVAPVAAQSLVERMDFNRTAGQVFEPLRKEGIEAIEIDAVSTRPGWGKRSATVELDDLPGFSPAPEVDNVLSDNTRIVTVRIENVAFKVGNKWRVNDGLASMWASLDDLAYVQRIVDGDERFGLGDRLVVQMRDRQLQTTEGDGITWEHSIQRVIEHRHIPPPDELPFDED
ncbi:hypothetical protein ACT8ZV_12905 [Nocardioides sp. MAHUQ-72]|uniref:hypothetical protein n=1 Tax=unclassified Nocardioides TaxID=2615069 RepID=UPI0036111ED6